MTHPRYRADLGRPHEDPLDEDEPSLWTLDDLHEPAARFATPLDHEILAPRESSDFSLPPPPHGASWDPF